MSIPLVQNNEKDSINTSIIAIKKNLERINSILGLVDSGSDIDTSEFVKKSDIVDVVQTGNMNPVTSNAVVPVDEVTLDNMHSVTSNAVANILKNLVKQSKSLPTDANMFPSGTFVRIYQDIKSANSLSHYPSLTNYSSAGGVPAWCLFHFQVTSGRAVQICTVQYYNTSNDWKNELFCRQKIDSTWFGWKSLHSLSN